MNTVIVKNYQKPPIDKKEILRYMGVRKTEASVESLMNNCLAECENSFSYKLCYSIFDIEINNDSISFPFGSLKSRLLANHIKGSEKAVIFAGTVGIDIDRLIKKYSVLAPSKAVVFQAIGAERIEALCDAFCEDLQKEYTSVKSRFSPGYGDLSLETQSDIINILNTVKNIGLSLNSSLLMSPSKSVTAIVGIK